MNPHTPSPRAPRMPLCLCAAVALFGTVAKSVRAQSSEMPPPQRVEFIEEDDRAGPRLGVAWVFGGSITAEKMNKRFSPFTTLFGWQFEHQFDPGPDLPKPITELVLLVGGIEQNLVLPTASFLLGFRQHNGVEFGVGPTITGAGLQVVLAGGITFPFGRFNLPVNLAVAPGGQHGASISLTTGFNSR